MGCHVDICSILVLHSCSRDICSSMILPRMGPTTCCRGTSCFTMVFPTGCREISAPAPGASLPLPSSLTLVFCRATCFSHISSPLFSLTAAVQHFLPYLKYIIAEAPPALLSGSALASTMYILEQAGTGCVQHVGSPSPLLTETNPLASPTTKTLPHKYNKIR